MKKRGNTLIECIVAMFIFLMATLIVYRGNLDYYKIENSSYREERIEKILESIKSEIQFNMTLCKAIEVFEKVKFLEIDRDIETKLVEMDILDILNNTSGEIAIEVDTIASDSAYIKIRVKDFEHVFKKEKWMEI